MRRILASLFACSTLLAQPNRLASPIDESHRVVLKGLLRLQAQPAYDRGRIDDNVRLTGISLLFKPSPDQQAALERLLADQQDISSPSYHAWLTPQHYAGQFGLSPSDLARIVAWLKTQGFSIDNVAQARNWILFSGTARQVQATFGTEIHRYNVDGQTHYANSSEPSIPAALAPLLSTITGLDDFHPKPPPHTLRPRYTASDGTHDLAPGDIATIYDISPLYTKNINGTGQKIAVMGQTAISLSDIEAFRSQFGLPANDPKLMLVTGSANPGITGDQAEADLDLEWSGAVAPQASIIFVYSTDVLTSIVYAIDQNVAPIISYSYGGCEPDVSGGSVSTANAFRSAAQQANAQGQTWVAASGDQGAAACDSGKAPAKNGLAVNLPASVPEVTAVGGTEFNEASGHYWNSTNAANSSSASSYIPEMAWNDTLVTGNLSATGGGMSIFFSKPVWQTGPGIPADGVRDVPDLAFDASSQHDPYIVVSGGSVGFFGGTSVATPVFAGVLALLNQYLVSNGGKAGLGNINPTLYSLKQGVPGIFHDVTVGTNEVPCEIGSLNCNSGSMGYNTGPGYNLATGLGSADVYNLVTGWTSHPTIGTTTSAAAAPPNILITATTTVTVTVKAASGTNTPGGSVSLAVGNTLLGTANLSGSGGTATASIMVQGFLLSTGPNTLKATYGGSTGFSTSSGTTSVTVSVPTSTSAVIPSAMPDPVYQQTPDTNGNTWFPTLRLTEIAGVQTLFSGFTINGQDYSSSIATIFGSRTLPAKGTLQGTLALGANLQGQGNVVFGFSGADLSGVTWSETLTVPFYGPQLSAGMSLASAPATEVLNPKGDPNCDPEHPYHQQLDLQELNGHEVYLNKFVAYGNDYTSNIGPWFGSWRLAPFGSLLASICWQLSSAPPQTLSYELDGTDDQGNNVATTLSVVFDGAGANVGALSASQSSVTLNVNPGQSTSTTLSVNAPVGQAWTLAVVPANQTTRWLAVSPLSGTGTTTVNLNASAVGFGSGAYNAALVLQCVNTIPQFVNVPVALVVGGSGSTTISGVANGAAFNQTFAPGMILSVFGDNLISAATPLYASSLPLPLSMGGASATINGVPAPFYYASPTQINLQIPYETSLGTALLAVNNGGQVATYSFPVTATAPGIFVGAGNALVPVSSASAGQILSLFMTGEGEVNPFLATGATPSTAIPVNLLPAPRNTPFTLTVGGQAVTPQFVGIPYGLVGETQVNFQIPANTPLGTQNVVVTVGGKSSPAAQITVTQ